MRERVLTGCVILGGNKPGVVVLPLPLPLLLLLPTRRAVERGGEDDDEDDEEDEDGGGGCLGFLPLGRGRSTTILSTTVLTPPLVRP